MPKTVKGEEPRKNVSDVKKRNNETLTGVYWTTVASCFPAAICFPLGLQQTTRRGKKKKTHFYTNIFTPVHLFIY